MARRKALTPALSRGERGTKTGRRRKSRGGYEFAGFAERARSMRQEPTVAEAVLWGFLRDRKLHDAKFRRQHQFHNYICDFYCDEAKLVIECDGSSHDTADLLPPGEGPGMRATCNGAIIREPPRWCLRLTRRRC